MPPNCTYLFFKLIRVYPSVRRCAANIAAGISLPISSARSLRRGSFYEFLFASSDVLEDFLLVKISQVLS